MSGGQWGEAPVQNSGRSQSPAARRHGAPAGFSCAGDPRAGERPRHRGQRTVRDPRPQRGSGRDSPAGERGGPAGTEGANPPGPAGLPHSTLHPPLRACRALTWQLAQQSPREHRAPARSEQLCAKQQGSGHSWSQKGEKGGQVRSARPGLGGGGGPGPALASRARRADLTWPAPQSHSSPSSTKPLPQRARRSGSPAPGGLERHEPRPLRKKARSWRRLQALNTRGNGCLRAGKGVGACRDRPLNALLLSGPCRTTRVRPHSCVPGGSDASGAEPREGA